MTENPEESIEVTATDGLALFCALDWIVTYDESFCPACGKDRSAHKPLPFNDPAAHEPDCAVQPYIRYVRRER